jgi:hypothetical protein
MESDEPGGCVNNLDRFDGNNIYSRFCGLYRLITGELLEADVSPIWLNQG